MSEETTQPPVEEATAADSGTPQADIAKTEANVILDELSKLGHKVTAALQQVWESPERKKAEDEIRRALKIAGDRIDEVSEDLRTSDVTKELKGQATKVVEAVEQSSVTKEIRKGLLMGLRKINEELTELLERDKDVAEKAAEAGQAAAEAGEAAAEAAQATAEAVADAVQK